MISNAFTSSSSEKSSCSVPVFPLEWHDPKTGEVSSGYRESGYFPEAVVNFLALLGWNPGTEQELFSLEELVEAFDITKCSKSGAKFDYQKGMWFNHEYILRKSDDEIAQLFAPIVANNGVEATMEQVTRSFIMCTTCVTLCKWVIPYSFLSFILGSLVKNPAFFKIGLNSASTSNNALEIP